MSDFDRHALTQQLRTGVAQQAVPLASAQIERLIDYLALLAKWNRTYNLTAVRDPVQMVTQHLLDSLAILPAFANAGNVLDVGSGGGLPGMVLAIWAETANPAMRISMIDTVNKKTAFLTQVKGELGLANVTVLTGRVEQLDVQQKFDVITSRAFADLADFVNWSQHLLAEGGRFIAMKGVQSDEEEAGLPAGWAITNRMPLTVPGLEAERHLLVIERR
ncbi:MAG: 16S rRNA (guanine(527)-N(7))-methyltransferase RsmG [Janthinobacterium lividum]